MPRLFVSIELPDEVKDALERLVDESRTQDRESRLRWARRSSFHLTLQFLGNVDEAAIADISRAIREAAGTGSRMTLSLDRPGTFGGKRPRVLWIGLRGDLEPLCDLVREIGSRLEPLGFAPEKRKYSPHITLARLSRKPGRVDHALMGTVISGSALPESPPFEISEVRLMRSELHPAGSRHHTVGRFPLSGA